MPAHFNWIRSSHGHVPEHAVEAGRTTSGEMLYVGRTFHNGIPCVGKVWSLFKEPDCSICRADVINSEARILFTRGKIKDASFFCLAGSEKSRCHVHPVWWEGNTMQGIRSLGTMLNFICDRVYKYTTRYFHLKLLGSLLKNELSINCEKIPL